MDERELVKRAARDMILDSLVDSGDPLDSIPDETAARLYDEMMQQGSEKTAEQKRALTPEEESLAKAAEAAFLGRIAARSYACEYLRGIEKIAKGLTGLVDTITGLPYEERVRRGRQKRQTELDLRPPETAMRELEEEQRAGQALRELMVKDLKGRQRLAEELRRLQLSDQYARREREMEMYRDLMRRPSAVRGGIGGAMAGLGAGALLSTLALPQIGPAAVKSIMKLSPVVGAGLGAGGTLLFGGPSRSSARIEKQMASPTSMRADVVV